MDSAAAYIPMDRRRAMAEGRVLPDRDEGAVLFVDISGFSRLTNDLIASLGERRGIEELTRQLNAVDGALIAEVHRYGGSVIGFSGDSIMCWFSQRCGPLKGGEPSLRRDGLRATACALAMQRLMTQFVDIRVVFRVTMTIRIKAVVSVGPARRFVVGDPSIQYIDTLVGQAVDRIRLADPIVEQGEVMLVPAAVAELEDCLQISAMRLPAASERFFAVISGLTCPVEPTSWSAAAAASTPEPPSLTEAQVRSWYLPPVYERLRNGQDQFLAEFRRTVSLFLNFTGIDFDGDDEAGLKLDAYIRWVQHILARYEGFLIQLSTGEKGIYLYACFGAPLAHDDDPRRAVDAAIELRQSPRIMTFLTDVRLALSRGQMRAGPVGSRARRTYGVLGDEVNLASRLMQKAKWGQILVSQQMAEAIEGDYHCQALDMVQIKGWSMPIPAFAIVEGQPTWSNRERVIYANPYGHDNGSAQFVPLFEAVQSGHGQVFRLESVPGVGKNQLVASLRQGAQQAGFWVGLSNCRRDDQAVDYQPWSQIFRALFKLPAKSVNDFFHVTVESELVQLQIAQLEAIIRETNNEWNRLLPLLGDLLGLPIADNDITSLFDPPLLRRGALFALTLEILQTWAEKQPLLLLIDEADVMDQVSFWLTTALAQMIDSHPVLLVLVVPPLPGRAAWWPERERLPNYNHLTLEGRFELGGAQRALDRVRQKDSDPLTPPASFPKPSLVGRQWEQAWLDERLRALAETGQSGTIIVTGEAGIGKSRLMAEMLKSLPRLAIMSLVGTGDAVEYSTPYHAWRPIFRQLFSLDAPSEDPVARSTYVLAQLPASGEPDLLGRASLLNAVLPLDLPENEITREMTGEGRAENTRNMLAALLKLVAKRSPLVLILEDAQWLDSASWALAQQVSQQVQPMLLFLVLRPIATVLPAEYHHFVESPTTWQLHLDPLSADETMTLVHERLGVKSLPERVMQLVRDKAEGHPFFSEELAYALRDAGLIVVEDGECQIAAHALDLSDIYLPDTIQGVITNRIDYLTAPQQLTLKIASVIGRNFAFTTLYDIYPIPDQKPQLAQVLDQLQRLDITLVEATEPELRYVFKHVITQEVVYNLLVFDQRQPLHRAVAQRYEQKYASDLDAYYPLLAHHWSRAGNTARALTYLEKAGERALRDGAYQEAINFFEEAAALAKRDESGVTPVRQARSERLLGQAHYGLGQLVESRAAFDRALTMLGWPTLQSRKQAMLGVAGQVLRQIMHRISLSRFRQRLSPGPAMNLNRQNWPERERLLEAAMVYERQAVVYYHANLTSLIFNAGLRSLNLAEQARGISPELARAYANMSITAGIVPIHPLARSYSRRAREIAAALNQSLLQADVLIRTSIYDGVCANWAEAAAAVERGLEIARRFSAWSSLGEGLLVKAMVEYGRGDFALSQQHFEELVALGKRIGNVQYQTWGRNGWAFHRWQAGQAEAALAILEQALPLFAANSDFVAEIIAYEVLALVQARLGNYPRARQANKTASRLIAEAPPNPLSAFFDYIFVAMVYLDLWELNQDRPPLVQEAFSRLALDACRALRFYGWLFPVGQPRVWLTLGRSRWLSGKPGPAQQAWHKSLAISQRLAMPYEQGLAHYEIGRHLPPSDPERQAHLTQAYDLFKPLGVPYDLAQVERALTGGV